MFPPSTPEPSSLRSPDEGGWVSLLSQRRQCYLPTWTKLPSSNYPRKKRTLYSWSPAAYKQSRSQWVIHGVQKKYLWSCISCEMEVGLAPRQGGCLLAGKPCACRPGPAPVPGGRALLSQPRAPPHRAGAPRGSARQGHRGALWVFRPLRVFLPSLCLTLHSVPQARQRGGSAFRAWSLLAQGCSGAHLQKSTTSPSPLPLLLPSTPRKYFRDILATAPTGLMFYFV